MSDELTYWLFSFSTSWVVWRVPIVTLEHTHRLPGQAHGGCDWVVAVVVATAAFNSITSARFNHWFNQSVANLMEVSLANRLLSALVSICALWTSAIIIMIVPRVQKPILLISFPLHYHILICLIHSHRSTSPNWLIFGMLLSCRVQAFQ